MSRWVRLLIMVSCAVGLGVVLLRAVQAPSRSKVGSLPHKQATFVASPHSHSDPAEHTPAPSRVVEDDDELDDDDEVENLASGSAPSVTPTSVRGTPVGKGSDERRQSTSDSDGSAFNDDDARAIFSSLAQQEGSRVSNDQFFSGVRVEKPTGTAEPKPEPTPNDEEGLPWVEGQSRGYTMLYAMQASAREVVERNVRALLAAHIKDVHIGVLIDGTFGQDFEYLRSIVSRLSSNGRRLTLVLYLSNGPTMRKWDTTPIDALFSRIDPREFRGRIIREQGLQSQFVEVARKAKRVFVFNKGLSQFNVNVAIPMLEDNLDRNAYRVMRDLARSEIRDSALFMRNPCVGCFSGNDGDSLGDPREEHTMKEFAALEPGDGFSLDGIGFTYPGVPGTIELSAEQLRKLMNDSYVKGLRYVGLWRHDWQGVEHGVPNEHPEQRLYRSSNDDELTFEIDVLRERLSLVVAAKGEDN